MIDRYDEQSGLMVMSRTTGFPCSNVVQMVVRGEIGKGGVCLRNCACHEKFAELARRGIRIASSSKEELWLA